MIYQDFDSSAAANRSIGIGERQLGYDGDINERRYQTGSMKYSYLFLLVSIFLGGCSGMSIGDVSRASSEGIPSKQVIELSPTTTLRLETHPTSNPTLTPTPTRTATITPTAITEINTLSYGPIYFPEGINPLTGIPVGDQQILERRPIVIKVTNFPRSVRPQWGLSKADHVYEYYIGDNMSRFVGIFYGEDAERVGPIRSARLFDRHIMRLYNAIFVFGWADDPILEFLITPELKRRLIVERGDNCPPLCRIGPAGAYNNLFINTNQIGAYLAERKTDNERPDLSGLRFEAGIPKGGHTASKLFIEYSAVSYHFWEYDPKTQRYLRNQESADRVGAATRYEAITDSLTGEQLATDNILVLLIPHEYYYKSSDTEIIEQLIQGEGKGYALRDGQVYPIIWKHDSPYAMFNFTLPDNTLYPLKPGNVWFEIVSDASLIEQLEVKSWGIKFVMPEIYSEEMMDLTSPGPP